MLKKDIHIESIYTELPFEERFRAAKADGFSAVEIWGWDNKNLPKVKQLLDENGLKLAAMGGDGPLSMCDPADRQAYIDYIKKALAAAKIVDCRTLIIHSDALMDSPQFAKPMSGEYSDLTRYLAMYDILKVITPMAEDAGVTFVLEALNTVKDHCGNFLDATWKSVDLVRAIGSPNLKILYDAYHMYLNEGKIYETTEKFLSSIGHIHIADAPGRNEPGTGVINFKNYLRKLSALGYEHYICYELFPAQDSKTAVAAIKKSFEE
jgi:hydroxypyruvate isomerase